ncbi:MAG: glycosyltransferase [Verrucomicrobiota bacterium]|nr:glycosyltransferase [Verrucomicrobiota bacterium]
MKVSRVPPTTPAPPNGCIVPEIVRTITQRPVVRGKFFFVGNQKFVARGVTYGPFCPDENGCAYHNADVAASDFALMALHGINTVRTYTCPPRWLLDVAAEQGLRVMVGVGLAGEQLSTFLDDRTTMRIVRERCADDVRSCAGHRALLAYSIGNEIPATIVRWHGRRRVEQFLKTLCEIVHENDDGLVTYVNYPTTEYLDLGFLDFLSFNVYLEQPERFESYLARLQNIADYKPLVMAEIGLDSLRNGAQAQAEAIQSQIRSSYAGGCAGVCVFSWTDEWHTGGADVENWKFGITDAGRRAKPALSAVSQAFADAPFPVDAELPRISVVVCTYNGSRTLRDCLEGCAQLKYPDYEIIVVNDGSTDATADVVRRFNVRLINTPNGGLSRARNLGLQAATGEIIAYVDDDGRPDEHWLRYLAHAFATTDHAGIGGPNIVPVDDPPMAQCVANSPGGPTHVLITDRLAEHIPGCNSAFRVDRLREVGGFDEQFRIAGDDVDVCWKLQAKGWTLGFHPAAVVSHHRRTSLKAYWRQQLNYGRAEAMLEVKWPEKYNAIGHIGWQGRLYGTGACRGLGWLRSRIYHGVWGTAAFQPSSVQNSVAGALPLMPEWYLMIVSLVALSALGLLWRPLLVGLPLAGLAVAAVVVQAARSASAASYPRAARPCQRLNLYATTIILHLIHPLGRLWGRVGYGLTPWRRRMNRAVALPRIRRVRIWSEQWQPTEERLKSIEAMLKAKGVAVRRSGAFDNWDLEVRGGVFASVRTRLGVEEYPGGRQYLHFRVWPTFCTPATAAAGLPAGLAAVAGLQQAWWGGGVLVLLAIVLVLRALGDCTAATTCLLSVLDRYSELIRQTPATDAPPAPSTAAVEVRVCTPDALCAVAAAASTPVSDIDRTI